MLWQIELEGHVDQLNKLAQIFRFPEAQILQEGERYYLRSDQLEPQLTYREVGLLSEHLLAALNGAIRLTHPEFDPIIRRGFHRLRDDGAKEIVAWIQGDSLLGGALGIAQVYDNDGQIVQTQPPEDLERIWLRLAISNTTVSKVLRLFGNNGNDHDWVSLYRIYEVIKEDVGTQLMHTDRWTTKSVITNFCRTANHPAAAGDLARHGATNDQPPPNPMALSEARSLIELLLHRWLDHKSNPNTQD